LSVHKAPFQTEGLQRKRKASLEARKKMAGLFRKCPEFSQTDLLTSDEWLDLTKPAPGHACRALRALRPSYFMKKRRD
jgi:hypothetical protein